MCSGEEDFFHDALEDQHNHSMSSASSQAGSRGDFDDRSSETSDPEPGIIDKVASWWQDFFNDKPSQEASSPQNGFSNGGPSNSSGRAKLPKPTHLSKRHGLHPIHTNSGASSVIVESDEPPMSGCITLFTASQAIVAQRKFLKAIKPPAGSSFTKITACSQDGNAAACSWGEIDPTTFHIRSKDYMRTKVKEPASGAIYRIIGVDMYSFDTKLSHIAQHVELPTPPTLGPGAQALPADKQLPPLLIINLQLPTYAPSVFGSTDGPGYSLVYYFALPEGWEPEMVGNEAALDLAQRFFHNGMEFDGQSSRDRFKLLPRVANVEEWGVKGPLSGAELRLLRSYNGKPLLTRPQHRFYTSAKGQYVEIDIDVHCYAYIARRAFFGYLTRLAPVIFENAFVLQGNRPEELPEVVLGAVTVYKVDFTKARPFPAESLEVLGHGTGEDGPPRQIVAPLA